MNKLIKYLALLSFSITTNVMAAGVPVFNFYELWALQELNHAKIDSSNIISVNYPCSITYLVNTNAKVFWPERMQDKCTTARRIIEEKYPLNTELEFLNNISELTKKSAPLN
ncbi:MAG: hypothetical protein HRU24_18895 [Gammaproteobacteria bacterium]|nr:hypothetical protein [Gammaproteobacteria bacterium]